MIGDPIARESFVSRRHVSFLCALSVCKFSADDDNRPWGLSNCARVSYSRRVISSERLDVCVWGTVVNTDIRCFFFDFLFAGYTVSLSTVTMIGGGAHFRFFYFFTALQTRYIDLNSRDSVMGGNCALSTSSCFISYSTVCVTRTRFFFVCVFDSALLSQQFFYTVEILSLSRLKDVTEWLHDRINQ